MRPSVICGIVISLGASLVQAEWAKEPTGYRGVPFGASQATAMATLDNLNVCTKDTGGGILACTDGRNTFHLGRTRIRERVFFPDGTLVQVILDFSSDDYAFIRSVFVEKFGEAGSTKAQSFPTKGGATFENEVAVWEGKDVVVMLERFGGSVDESRAIISTKQFIEAEARRAENERRRAAASF